MEIVFQRGRWSLQYPKTSVTSRRDGPGGKMYVPRAMNSLRMSFCTVPESAAAGTPGARPP